MISPLTRLKSATTLSDVAAILGFKPKSLAYIIRIKSPAHKYIKFQIPKRSGGMRDLQAPYPDLKNLQRRLAEALESCIKEINQNKEIKSVLAHGFRPDHSIITNAFTHRKKVYVFNIDLENFFGSINFGRVRGFFISNRNFQLHPTVATVLAQIACHENSLPQGSPCSPVISNLIGHIVDIKLAKLAFDTGCTYSRYADDITFSTRKKIFPEKIAAVSDAETQQWKVGNGLSKLIKKAGFNVNESKTRMQYHYSRQDVTGLVVNRVVNTRVEYRRNTRAMVHELLKEGSYKIKTITHDAAGVAMISESSGTLAHLHGRLSFIDSVYLHSKNKITANQTSKKKSKSSEDTLSSFEKTYKRFLIYKYFYNSDLPVILCEGKTDNVYLKYAIQSLATSFPKLATNNASGHIDTAVKLFTRSPTSARLLKLNGGSGELSDFVREYLSECKKISAKGMANPVIILIDNDSGAGPLIGHANNIIKPKVATKSDTFIHLGENLYIVLTPLLPSGGDTMIETFFKSTELDEKLGGKSFNPDEKSFDHKIHYGKALFAEYVVKKKAKSIDFSDFAPLLERLTEVINEHSKKVSALATSS